MDCVAALATAVDFETRLRCGRALLALTDERAELQKRFPEALALVEREIGRGGEPDLVREHVFHLLALALEREPVRIAARAFMTDDAYVRGTALEYLETVLTPRLFSALKPLLAGTHQPPVRRRSATEVRDDLDSSRRHHDRESRRVAAPARGGRRRGSVTREAV